MVKLLISLLLLASIAVGTVTTAFVLPKSYSSASEHPTTDKSNAAAYPSSSSTLLSLSSSPDNINGEGFKTRTDIRNFLTQRSIQSFVYLLNQCREEHTVRWLEKTLDFTSIDNFHGTGAFNQTKFPEWDSIFLDCVDRPEEVIVIQILQQRRQRKLSSHNAYFESLTKQPSTPTTTPTASTSSSTTKKTEETKRTTRGFSGSAASSYLNNMTPATTPSSSTKKPQQVPKKASRRLSSASSYLNNLSAAPSASINKKNEPERTKEKKQSIGKDGKGTSYLESLSSAAAPASSSDSKKTKEEKVKSKQSTETSKNPYLEERTQEYELSVDPSALVRRILSVREQLSEEWVEDLDMLMKLNDEITESFEEYNKAAAKDDEEDDDDDDDDDDDENMSVKSKIKEEDDDDDDEKLSDLDMLLKALDPLADKDTVPDVPSPSPSASSKTETETDTDTDTTNTYVDVYKEKRHTVFDRNILNSYVQSLWCLKRSSSPYRKSNFDLLLLLATQESIHRVLNSYKEDEKVRPETYEWLLDFYKDNVNDHFDGHQTYARSEDFLEEMMKAPRTLIETNNNDILAWVDPASVAEDIVRERSEVTLDWMRVAETISDEHTDLRRLLFTNMVSKSLPDESLSDIILTAVKKETEEGTTSSPTKVFGAFE